MSAWPTVPGTNGKRFTVDEIEDALDDGRLDVLVGREWRTAEAHGRVTQFPDRHRRLELKAAPRAHGFIESRDNNAAGRTFHIHPAEPQS